MASTESTHYYVAITQPVLPKPICYYFGTCTLTLVVGICLFIITVPVIFLTGLTIYAHFKSGNLSKNGSPIFILSVWSLLISLIILIIIGFYVSFTLVFETYWPDNNAAQTFGYIIGTTLQSLIFCGSLFNMVLAINRALAMGSTKTNVILSRKAYNIIAMFILPVGFVIGYVPPYVMTCCKYEFHNYFYHFYTAFFFMTFYAYQSFSIAYVSAVYDPIHDKYVELNRVTYKYVHRPFFIIATIIPIVCYTYVFGYIFWMKRKMKTINSNIRAEIIRSILFALVFFCYMCSWIYFDLMFIVGIANTSLAFNITSMLFMVLEAAANGILQATMIRTVRNAIQKTFSTVMTSKKKKTGVVVQRTIQSVTTF